MLLNLGRLPIIQLAFPLVDRARMHRLGNRLAGRLGVWQVNSRILMSEHRRIPRFVKKSQNPHHGLLGIAHQVLVADLHVATGDSGCLSTNLGDTAAQYCAALMGSWQ